MRRQRQPPLSLVNVPAAPADPPSSQRIGVVCPEGTNIKHVVSELSVGGVLTNASTITTFSNAQIGQGDVVHAMTVLRKAVKASEDGDQSLADSLLVSQAIALNAMFNDLARRSALNIGEHFHAADTYMRLALKAQNQCRATLESLSKIKNPPTVSFVKQSNIAHGHQQVNNGVGPGDLLDESANPASTRVCVNPETAPIKLLDGRRG